MVWNGSLAWRRGASSRLEHYERGFFSISSAGFDPDREEADSFLNTFIQNYVDLLWTIN